MSPECVAMIMILWNGMEHVRWVEDECEGARVIVVGYDVSWL